MLTPGAPAPDFKAASTSGEIHLASLLEQGPVVLFFFPKANTSG